MPATEQTWRDNRTLHVIFGVSSLALLATTIWMLVADHNRPWKPYAEAMRTADVRLIDMQAVQAEAGRFQEELQRRQDTLAMALAMPPDPALFHEFLSRAKSLTEKADGQEPLLASFDGERYQQRYRQLAEAKDAGNIKQATKLRGELLDGLRGVAKRVKFDEDLLSRDKKIRSSERDAARSEYNLAIRDGLPESVQAERLRITTDLERRIADLEKQIQRIKAIRIELDDLLKRMVADETAARKEVDDFKQEIDRLHKAREERAANAGKRLLEMPIIDAFNTPLKIDQIWLPRLTIKYPLNNVARFDRCRTCHAGIDKANAGDPRDPAYPAEKVLSFTLTPIEPKDGDGKPSVATFENLYGMTLAPAPLLKPGDVAVVVFPKSAAAIAGLRTADVLERVDGKKINGKEEARRYLVNAVEWGKPLQVEVRRGLPQPYSAHPRLDLIGSDSSPHPFGKVGCTICHEGQGTATAFQHAEHTPNSIEQRKDWVRMHGWYANHYWDWPQRPLRFVESSCLKCHHDVESLEASDRFPEPPAKKLVEGYQLVRRFGCFGCHEIKGYNGPMERIGPDLRLEPDYFAHGHAAEKLVAPLLATHRAKYDAAVAAEQKINQELIRLTGPQDPSTAAKEPPAAKTADPRVAQLQEQLKKATDERLQAGVNVVYLSEIEELARKVHNAPEDAAARRQLAAILRGDQEQQRRAKDLEALRPPFIAAAAKLEEDKQKLAAATAALAAEKQKQPDAGKLSPEDQQKRQAEEDRIAAEQKRIEDEEKRVQHGLAFIESRQAESLAMLPPDLQAIGDKLADIETPGTYRKVGPSVRYVGHKLDLSFLLDWIEQPRRFRDSTRMPHVFGNFQHLDADSKTLAERLEKVEIRGIAEYLLAKSEKFDYLEPPQSDPRGEFVPVASDEEKQQQIERGRTLFATRGCLSCHSIKHEGREIAEDDLVGQTLTGPHRDARYNQAPDLSHIGAKLAAGAAQGRDPRRWLYSWIKQPSRYNARTKMPDLFLEPTELLDRDGTVVPVTNGDGKPVPLLGADGKPKLRPDGTPIMKAKLIDPAADIAAYLMSLQGWQVKPVDSDTPENAKKFAADLNELAEMHLAKTFSHTQTREYLARGIFNKRREDLKGDEIELLVPPGGVDARELEKRKLLYVGRRAISKYGCYGCHDIPGFEDAKPIGTGLADWGRKETDKLAFEQIVAYLGGHGHGHGSGHGNGHDAGHGGGKAAAAASEPKTDEAKRIADDEAFFLGEVMHGTRDGFLWQKLREPRSYDYRQTQTKPFNDWLRMPQFNFTADEREAVMTFILGLVADPPIAEYVYNPPPPQRAVIEGRKVLEKYNCGGCHVLKPERLAVRYHPSQPGQPGDFPPPDKFAGFDFLRDPPTKAEIEASTKVDITGRAHATLYGLRAWVGETPTDALLTTSGDVYDPSEPKPAKLLRMFSLWRNATLDGQKHYVGVQPLKVDTSTIDEAHSHPAEGGDLARLMFPLAYSIVKAQRNDLTVNGPWAVVPPPLIGEGRKVQSAWLRDFLLDPYPIRPAALLRMPRFNMSADEASVLAAYFAAVDGAEHPYVFDPKTRPQYVHQLTSHGNRLDAALRVVAKVCTECHMVGDFQPKGKLAAMAPNLDLIHRRMRPEYLRQWIANPPSILPYTNMPVNFPHDKLNFQDVLPGTSAEQIDAVVDLLMNYDQYSKLKSSISQLVPADKGGALKTDVPGPAKGDAGGQ